jgi:YD repeat-containing protein
MHVGWIRGATWTALAGVAGAFGGSAAAAPETTTYRYDALGRLVASSGESSETALQYDAAGNRIAYSVAMGARAAVADWSFEDPPVGAGYQYVPAPAGAVFANAAGVAGNGSAWGFDPPPDGSQAAFLQSAQANASTIALAVSGMVPGIAYRVRFRLSGRPNYYPLAVTVLFDGAPLGAFTPAAAHFAETISGSFTPAAATGTLTFRGEVVAGDRASGIDAVVVERAP